MIEEGPTGETDAPATPAASGVGAPGVLASNRRRKWLVIGAVAAVLIAVLAYVGLSFLGAQVAAVLKGTVEFGTAGKGCQVEGRATTFTTAQSIHIVAHLNRDVRSGETVTLTALHGTGELDSGDIPVAEDANCITGTVAGSTLPVGHIELRYTVGTETLAEGTFDVTSP